MIQTDPKMFDTLQNNAGIVSFENPTMIEMTGDDRTKHLNGFCTADISKLQSSEGCEAFLLNIKGKALGFVTVFCCENSLLLVTVPGQAEKLIAHLDRYVIREDVVFADRSKERQSILICGTNAEKCLALTEPGAESGVETEAETALGDVAGTLPGTLYAHCDSTIGGHQVMIARTNMTGFDEFSVFVDACDFQAVMDSFSKAGALEVNSEAFEVARIAAGYPYYGVDISEENLPQEVGRDQLAISFTKGCYLGQETVARLDALGHVNKILRKIVFNSAIEIESGCELFDAEESSDDRKNVGSITSVCLSADQTQTICLGYVKTKFAKAGSDVFAGDSRGAVIDAE